MSDFDVIVVGAGLGGLTAGAKLAKRGKKVLIIEQHSIPGGCATTFLRKGCKIEAGLHEMDGLDEEDMKYPLFKELGIFDNVKLIKLKEFYRYVAGDFEIVLPHGNEEVINALVSKFPDEEKGIRKFIGLITAIRRDVNRFCKMPVWMQKAILPLAPFVLPALTFNMFRKVGPTLSRYIKNEQLKAAIMGNIYYYHDNPASFGMVYFSAGNASYYKGAWFVEGGSQELSNYLASIVVKNGGKLIYKQLVTKIITEGNTAIGVEYISKNEPNAVPVKLYAKTIVANAAVPNVANQLLSGEAARRLQKKIKGMENSLSLLTVFFILDKPTPEIGNHHYSTMVEHDNVTNAQHVNELFSSDYTVRPYIFCDYGQIDSKLAPEGKSHAVICCVDRLSDWEHLSPDEYKNKKEQVAQIFIHRLNALVPGIKEHISYYEVGTPKTLKKYILTPGGSVYGFSQIVKQSGILRLGVKSPVKNLYFASAWAFPGGGFTGAMISGDICAKSIR